MIETKFEMVRATKKLMAIAIAIVLIAGMMPLGLLAAMTNVEAVTVVHFEPLAPEVAHQIVPFGTELCVLVLPEYLEAVVLVSTFHGQQMPNVIIPPGSVPLSFGGGGIAQVGAVFNLADMPLDGLDTYNHDDAKYDEPEPQAADIYCDIEGPWWRTAYDDCLHEPYSQNLPGGDCYDYNDECEENYDEPAYDGCYGNDYDCESQEKRIIN